MDTDPETAASPAQDTGPAQDTDAAQEAAPGQEPAAERDDGRARAQAQLPWAGKPGRADILCWAGITLSGLYYLVLLPFRASLVGTHPIALEILNGSTEAIVAAAAFARIGHGTLLVVMLASIPGLMKFDLLYWWAGRLWGERVIHLMFSKRGRSTRYLGWAERWGRWIIWPAMVLAPFLPIPTAIIYIIAGWSGMSLVTFLILDLIGSMMWAGLLAGLGYELGHRAVVVAQTISRYGLWISLGIVALIIVSQIRRARQLRAGGPGVGNPGT
ncbi:MAG TPA: VTT domain-containing protein [Streptosporangiaceae bacterium]|jgi:membrane protein DedA with SNARE-associated domain